MNNAAHSTTARAATKLPSTDPLVWLAWADRDYIAARTLLLAGLLVQACALASTAIEKYLKLLCALHSLGPYKHHQLGRLLNSLHRAGIHIQINSNFISLLSSAYKMRYFDDLEYGYSITLVERQIFFELDSAVHSIRSNIQIYKNEQPAITIIEALIADRDRRLLDLNCFFGSCSRSDLFEPRSRVYEMRVLADGRILEVQYTAAVTPDDPLVLEGLLPADRERSGSPR